MKNKTIKPMLIIASLAVVLGLSSCKKECMNEFKKELKKEFSNCDSSSTGNPDKHLVTN